MRRNISKKNGRELIDVTTHKETNGELSIRTIFGRGSGFGYGRRLRGVVCPLSYYYCHGLASPAVVFVKDFSSLFSSETAAPISFKFGLQLPYIWDYKNSLLCDNPTVNVAITTLLSVWGVKVYDFPDLTPLSMHGFSPTLST